MDCLRATERRQVVITVEENLGPHTCPQDHISQFRRLTYVSKQRNMPAILSQMKQNTKENSREDVVDRMPVSTVLFHSQQE